MMRKSITNCALVSFVVIVLTVDTIFAAGDGYDNIEAQTDVYWKGFLLIILLLVGLLAIGIKASRRSHQEDN